MIRYTNYAPISMSRNNIHMKVWNIIVFNVPASLFFFNFSTRLFITNKQWFNHINLKFLCRQAILTLELTDNIQIVIICICNWTNHSSKGKRTLRINTNFIIRSLLIYPFPKIFIGLFCCLKHFIANINVLSCRFKQAIIRFFGIHHLPSNRYRFFKTIFL